MNFLVNQRLRWQLFLSVFLNQKICWAYSNVPVDLVWLIIKTEFSAFPCNHYGFVKGLWCGSLLLGTEEKALPLSADNSFWERGHKRVNVCEKTREHNQEAQRESSVGQRDEDHLWDAPEGVAVRGVLLAVCARVHVCTNVCMYLIGMEFSRVCNS